MAKYEIPEFKLSKKVDIYGEFTLKFTQPLIE